MRDLVFVALFIPMLFFVVGRPHIGALLWIWVAMLVPNAYLYGFATSAPFNMIVAIVMLLSWLTSKEPVRIPLNSTVVIMILLGILGTVSAILTIGSPEVTWDEWNKFIKIIFFALIVTSLMTTRERITGLIFAICLSVGFHGVVEGLKFLASGGGHDIVGPGSSILGDNNNFALAMLCVIPLMFFLLQQTTHRLMRLVILGSTGTMFLSVIGTFSRGGLIGLSAISIWGFYKSKRKIRFLALAIPFAAVLIAFAPDRWSSRMDTISTANQDGSFMGRVIAWKQSTLIALDNPILGGGFHSVQNYGVWKTYSLTRFDSLNFIPTDRPDPYRAHAAHSIYFETLGDLGFVGLFLFCLLGLTAWRNSLLIVRKAAGREDLKWVGLLAQSLQYTVLAYFVAGAALSMAYFELMYVLYAVLATLRQIVENESTDTIASAKLSQ